MKMNIIIIAVGSVLIAVGIFRYIADRKRVDKDIEKVEIAPYNQTKVNSESSVYTGTATGDNTIAHEPVTEQNPDHVYSDNSCGYEKGRQSEETNDPKQKGE